MDKMKGMAKGVAKGGWHPPGDPSISRATWKEDLKGIATGKKKDPYENARNHQSTPMTSLKDPDSFGPPPKANSHSSSTASPSTLTTAPTGGLGSPIPAPRPRQQEPVEEAPKPPPVPYRTDTTGLRTDNLPKPPVRRDGPPAVSSPARNAPPSLPARQTPTLPARQNTGPPPILPPRMTEHPDEHTPPPPPTYNEATSQPSHPATINAGAANRLAQAGVSVPGFGIGAQSTPPASPRGPQMSELQERFSRMGTGQGSRPSTLDSPTAAAHKKPPPPPPPKRVGLGGEGRPLSVAGAPEPPPLPLGSKPRPTG